MVRVEDLKKFLSVDINDTFDDERIATMIKAQTTLLVSSGIPEVFSSTDPMYETHVSLIAKLISPDFLGSYNVPANYNYLINQEKYILKQYYLALRRNENV